MSWRRIVAENLFLDRSQDHLRDREAVVERLIEIAAWSSNGHAQPARLVLGRLAGIPEERLKKLVAAADTDAIVRALRERR